MAKQTYEFLTYCESRDSDGNRISFDKFQRVQLTAAEAKTLGDVVRKVSKAKADDDNNDPGSGNGDDEGGEANNEGGAQ